MAGDSEKKEDNEIDFDFVEAIVECASEWVKSLNSDDLQSLNLPLEHAAKRIRISAADTRSQTHRSSYWKI